MKDKYFTPEITELFIGYQCEYFEAMAKDNWISHILSIKDFELFYYEEEFNSIWFDNNYRTPYLTKKHIEKEGWVVFDFDNDGVVWFKKDNYELIYFDTYKTTNRIMVKYFGGVVFEGKIKCLNELKTLMKFLEI